MYVDAQLPHGAVYFRLALAHAAARGGGGNGGARFCTLRLVEHHFLSHNAARQGMGPTRHDIKYGQDTFGFRRVRQWF